MKARLLAALSLAVAPGCATVTHLDASAGMSEAKVADDRCDALAKAAVPESEERVYGDALGVSLVSKFGGAEVTVPAEADFSTPQRVHLVTSPDNALTRYVMTVGKSLARLSDRPNLSWTFGVIDSDEINAFSAPGGWVFLSRGLLRTLPDEAALAGILGHEIAHVTLRHQLANYQRAKYDECVSAYSRSQMVAATAAVSDPIQDTINRVLGGSRLDLDDPRNYEFLSRVVDESAASFLRAGVDREQELEADREGLLLAMRAGYNPESYVQFVGTLPRDGSPFLSHQPAPVERRAALSDWRTRLAPKVEFATADEIARYPKPPLGPEVAALKSQE